MYEDPIGQTRTKGPGWHSMLAIDPVVACSEAGSRPFESARDRAQRARPVAADDEAAIRLELQAGYLETHGVRG